MESLVFWFYKITQLKRCPFSFVINESVVEFCITVKGKCGLSIANSSLTMCNSLTFFTSIYLGHRIPITNSEITHPNVDLVCHIVCTQSSRLISLLDLGTTTVATYVSDHESLLTHVQISMVQVVWDGTLDVFKFQQNKDYQNSKFNHIFLFLDL